MESCEVVGGRGLITAKIDRKLADNDNIAYSDINHMALLKELQSQLIVVIVSSL